MINPDLFDPPPFGSSVMITLFTLNATSSRECTASDFSAMYLIWRSENAHRDDLAILPICSCWNSSDMPIFSYATDKMSLFP